MLERRELESDERQLLKLADLDSLASSEAWVVTGSNQRMSYSTHGIFRYFGKFPPPIAAALIEEFSDPGDLVLDPMCGSGTTGVEALHANRRADLVDVNPLSVLVSQVKVRPFDPVVLQREFERIAAEYAPVPPGPAAFSPVGLRNPDHWFLEETSNSLRGLRAGIEHAPPGMVRDALWVAFAGSVRECSRATTQQGRLFLDAGSARADAMETFSKRVSRIARALESIRDADPQVQVSQGDARDVPLGNDAVLTILHPPYFNAYRYSSVNSLELAWLGWDQRDVRRGEVREFFKVGRRENAQRYLEDMSQVLEVATRATRSGGALALMIGDTTLQGDFIPVTRPLVDCAPSSLHLDRVIVRVPRFTEATWVASQRRTKDALGIRLMDYILIFRKK